LEHPSEPELNPERTGSNLCPRLSPRHRAWPARAAYFSAAIFTGASGTINVTYGWQKGGDLAGSLTWAAVAAAVAIVFALSWPR
jgi:hypothetical protein